MSELYYYRAPQNVEPRALETDICIYGGTSAGVIAAWTAAREGKSCVIIETTGHLGGLTCGGLSETDFGKKPAIGGQSLEFYRLVGREYGIEEEWHFEPKVAERVMNRLAEESGAQIFTREYLASVEMDGRKIVSLTTESGLKVKARAFFDCSYEGDLLAAAGCSFHVGRESNDVYGETINGAQVHDTHQFNRNVSPYVIDGRPESGLLPGIEAHQPEIGKGDHRLQAYNFRLCLTNVPENRQEWTAPEGYDRADYILLERYMLAGWTALEVCRKFDKLRGGKCDKNNYGAVSTDYIGYNWDFPNAGFARREEIFQAHVKWQKGLMYFMATDPVVPAEARDYYSSWGLTRDEFLDCGGWSHAIYIREGRRLVGDYVINENDCQNLRACDDSVGLGSYNMDSHNCTRFVDENGYVRNEGDVQKPPKPYPISYRSIVPRRGEAENLWVPVPCSTSHIAFGSLRMEPVWMILGQSAAIAACIALDNNQIAQDVDYNVLRPKLEAAGQILHWK
ncbi:MAG TPA: FAD-dependent oxidoreductase, partial [Abditibacteriaceae bacterium]